LRHEKTGGDACSSGVAPSERQQSIASRSRSAVFVVGSTLRAVAKVRGADSEV
jgi:hypothetical protein